MVRFWRVGLALCSTSHPRLKWPLVRMRHRGGNVLRDQAFYERLRASPLNPMESGTIHPLGIQGCRSGQQLRIVTELLQAGDWTDQRRLGTMPTYPVHLDRHLFTL